MRKFHDDGTIPTNGEVWVFGSNMAGRHGAGAAKVAREKFGMPSYAWGGRWGQCYAIPTKDDGLKTLTLGVIQSYVQTFITYAHLQELDEFFITRVGCGLAGYRDEQIAPMFVGAPENCSFTHQWKPYL